MKKSFGGIIINPYCDFNCLFCNGIEKASEKNLREQEVRIYKNLQDFKKEGIKAISISGADPIEYKHLSSLIIYIKKNFDTVRILTHGEKLKNQEIADKLISSGVDELQIPIYGSNSSIHDSVTGKKGSFEKTIKGIKYIKKKTSTISFKITTVIVKHNKDDLIKTVDLINGLSINDHTLTIPFIADGNYSFYIPLKDLSPYVKEIYNYTKKVNAEINFTEIPFCVFELIDLERIKNKTHPPNLGKYNQPPDRYKTEVPDVPVYRLKKEAKICPVCKAFKECDGFLVNDIDKFGLGDLKPIE